LSWSLYSTTAFVVVPCHETPFSVTAGTVNDAISSEYM